MQRRRKGTKRDVLIDLTSLLDVMFIILLVVLWGQQNKNEDLIKMQAEAEQAKAQAEAAKAAEKKNKKGKAAPAETKPEETKEEKPEKKRDKKKDDLTLTILMAVASGLCLGIVGILIYWIEAFLK